MTTLKTVAVFAIIFGCFAVLYPKIFHPMLLHLLGMAPSRRSADDMSKYYVSCRSNPIIIVTFVVVT